MYGTYRGRRTEARFLPATRRVAIVSGPLAGTEYDTPSAAAGAVVAHANPRRATRVNGWAFWRVAATRARLDTVRA